MPIDHFGLLASTFDRSPKLSFTPSQIIVLSIPIKGRLLDAGGGTGRMAEALRDQVGLAVVADISLGMLRRAAAKFLPVVCAGAEQLPFPDGSFDRVVMRDAFHHLANQTRSARELWRVLAPEGRIVICEPDIQKFSVKLLAIFEKMLLMRSHFNTAERIADLFARQNAQIELIREAASVWIVVKK
jgi:demethylmenaquinone methyltransferase/2-methoxy-6-polyprenyl-1,4-benzoquinol methylase